MLFCNLKTCPVSLGFLSSVIPTKTKQHCQERWVFLLTELAFPRKCLLIDSKLNITRLQASSSRPTFFSPTGNSIYMCAGQKKVSLQKRWIIICFDENLIFVSIFHDFFLIVSLFSFQSSRRFRRSLKSKCLEGFRLIRKSLLALKSLLQFFHPPATTSSIYQHMQHFP